MKAFDLILSVACDGVDPSVLVENITNEEINRTSNRPRKRRFGNSGDAINPITGKRKDPKRRLIARIAARKFKAKRKASVRKFNVSSKGRNFHKKLGKLVARIRRK